MTTLATGRWTVGSLAKELRRKPAAVNYVISTFGIQPAERVGIIRVFDDHAAARIRSELARIDRERGQ